MSKEVCKKVSNEFHGIRNDEICAIRAVPATVASSQRSERIWQTSETSFATLHYIQLFQKRCDGNGFPTL
jgi:hypothetical protein